MVCSWHLCSLTPVYVVCVDRWCVQPCPYLITDRLSAQPNHTVCLQAWCSCGISGLIHFLSRIPAVFLFLQILCFLSIWIFFFGGGWHVCSQGWMFVLELTWGNFLLALWLQNHIPSLTGHKAASVLVWLGEYIFIFHTFFIGYKLCVHVCGRRL